MAKPAFAIRTLGWRMRVELGSYFGFGRDIRLVARSALRDSRRYREGPRCFGTAAAGFEPRARLFFICYFLSAICYSSCARAS